MPISQLHKGAYIVLHGRPCRITEYNIFPEGKMGKAKVQIVGEDIFSNRRLEELLPTVETLVDVPFVKEKFLQLSEISIDEMTPIWYKATVLDELGQER